MNIAIVNKSTKEVVEFKKITNFLSFIKLSNTTASKGYCLSCYCVDSIYLKEVYTGIVVTTSIRDYKQNSFYTCVRHIALHRHNSDKVIIIFPYKRVVLNKSTHNRIKEILMSRKITHCKQIYCFYPFFDVLTFNNSSICIDQLVPIKKVERPVGEILKSKYYGGTHE